MVCEVSTRTRDSWDDLSVCDRSTDDATYFRGRIQLAHNHWRERASRRGTTHLKRAALADRPDLNERVQGRTP